ncbi:MAG: hypothetical protein CO032_06270, partial [Nitrosopumilales archaeon CG_4_9_14_0_2_um_filter_34_16]
MAKYNEEKGFIKGISDEEFEVLLRLSFALNEFQIDKIKRSVLVANDFVLGLFRVEKRFLKGERIYNYVAYIDRKHHEYSDKWMSDFWARVNSNDFPLYSRLDKEIERILHKTIKKVTEDIENFRFNTAISALMILVNELQNRNYGIWHLKTLIFLLVPFAPHISEELWQKYFVQGGTLNIRNSIHYQLWPKYDPKLIKEEMITLVIQVNGKV